MRILQIVSSSATSGAEHHSIVLSRELKSRGHQVAVVCPPIPWIIDSLQALGVETHPMDLKAKVGLPALRQVSALLKSQKFDVIHTHLSRAAYLGFVAGTIRRVPVVSTVHVETREPLYRYLPIGRNRLVAPSNFIRGLLRGRGVPDHKIDVVYNGTDFTHPESAANESVFEEFAIPRTRKLIGLVGRIAEEKGQGIAVQALPRVLDLQPEAHLLFVGRTDNAFHHRLKEQIKRLDLESHVTFTGDRKDVARLIDAVEFTILPSVMESFGLAVIESMARAKPAVVSRVGALSELVSHQVNGLVIDKTTDAFSEAMAYLLANPEECRRMGLAGREAILEKFTVAQMVERMEAVYAKTAKN